MGVLDYLKIVICYTYGKGIERGIKPKSYEKKEFHNFITALDKNCRGGYGLVNSLNLMKIIKHYPYEVECELFPNEVEKTPLCPSYTIESIIKGDVKESLCPRPGQTYSMKMGRNLSKIFSSYLSDKLNKNIKAVKLSFLYN